MILIVKILLFQLVNSENLCLRKKNDGKDKKKTDFDKRNELKMEVQVKLNQRKELSVLNAQDMVT